MITETVLPQENKGFSSGDLVRLKSDGPVMTVVYHRRDNTVMCIWYNVSTSSYNTFDFYIPDLLEKVG